MVNLIDVAEKWMKENNIEVTIQRTMTLTSLFAKIENEAYNDGIHRRF